MHIYGVGANGNIGSGVQLLMNKKYNQSKQKMGGRSFEKKHIPATVNAEVIDTRVTIDSNRVSKIRRPFLTVDAEVRDVWGDVSDDITHVSFLPENRPKMTYIYPLSNEEIKGFIDAGLYHNPRFEALLQNLMESEQFEITQDVDLQKIDVMQDGELTPVILVQDLGLVKQDLDSHENDHYTSFDYAIERAVDMALQLEAEGISTSALIGEEELSVAQEIEVEIDDVFDISQAREQMNEEMDLEVMRQIQEMDSEVDVSDAIDVTKLFGKSSEEERISQLREANIQGKDWDDIEHDDIFGDEEDEQDDFGFDDVSDDSFELVDTMEVDLDNSGPVIEDDEDELEL